LQSGILYERTITPDPPFDVAFPPHVFSGDLSTSRQEQQVTPDTTRKLTGLASLPLFFVTSAHGVEGWSAYLRDATTKRPISPIRTLHDSTADAGVLLPTSHVGPLEDALTNFELVIVPQVDSGLPTYVPNPVGLTKPQVAYPLVPEPMTFTGQIDWFDGQPAVADVTFEAAGIYSPPQPIDSMDAGLPDATTGAASDAGLTYPLLTQGFEYVTTTTAQPDAGVSIYGIQIPRGAYRVSVRPHDDDPDVVPPDGSTGAKHAVTVLPYDTESSGDAGPPPLTVGPTSRVRGTATVVDSRPLAAATVEAIPVHCPLIVDAGGPPNDSPACMPRYATTVTDSVGSFALDLDPGDYLLRVQPLNGTRLPWVVQAFSVGEGLSTQPLEVTIPAPVYRGLEVQDNLGQPVANAIVRVFTMQGRGPAIEVGRAITDENGRFDMYLDPAVQ
jgi:hypothetical protein